MLQVGKSSSLSLSVVIPKGGVEGSNRGGGGGGGGGGGEEEEEKGGPNPHGVPNEKSLSLVLLAPRQEWDGEAQ